MYNVRPATYVVAGDRASGDLYSRLCRSLPFFFWRAYTFLNDGGIRHSISESEGFTGVATRP